MKKIGLITLAIGISLLATACNDVDSDNFLTTQQTADQTQICIKAGLTPYYAKNNNYQGSPIYQVQCVKQ